VIRIKDAWEDDLVNVDSTAFEQLESKITDGMAQLFGRFRDYAGVDVISFRQDNETDVIAKIDLKLIDTVGAVPCHLEKDLLTHVLRIVLEEAVFTDGKIGELEVDVLSLIMPQKLHAKFTTDELKPRWKPFCNVLSYDEKGHSKSIVHALKTAKPVLPSGHESLSHTTTFTSTGTKKSGQPVVDKTSDKTQTKQ